jgi:cytochrome P450
MIAQDQVVFSPLSKDYVYRPHELFAKMRAADPVYFLQGPAHLRGWYIFRDKDCRYLLKDPDACITKFIPRKSGRRKPDISELLSQQVLFADGADHSRYRAVIAPLFDSTTQSIWQQTIHEAVLELVGELRTGSQIDLVKDFAEKLPSRIIAHFFEATSDTALRQWADAMVGLTALATPVEHVRSSLMGMTAYLIRMLDSDATQEKSFIQKFREAESENLVSRAESVGNLAFLIAAGYETAANAIATGAISLVSAGLWKDIASSEQYEMVADECLRFDGPLKSATPRWAARAFDIGEHEVKTGDRIFLILSSANRDENAHTDANQFILNRRGPRHLGFGSGLHHCVGAQVARLEIGVALASLAKKFPRLALETADINWHKSLLIRGPTALPARLLD